MQYSHLKWLYTETIEYVNKVKLFVNKITLFVNEITLSVNEIILSKFLMK